MGLDASVMCNCFRQQRTSNPPVPREWLHIDEDGYLSLRPERESDEAFFKVYEWEQTACEHPGMEQASEHIGNWSGYRAFQEALEQAGWHLFPTLEAELPENNGGQTSPASARLCLEELACFRSLETLGEKACLVDSATGEEVHRHIAAYDGVFVWAGSVGLEVGLGEFDFFVRDASTGSDLFRSRHFRQRVLEPKRVGRDWDIGEVELTNMDSGERFRSPVAVRGRQVPWPSGRWEDDEGRCNFAVPVEFHVEARPILPQDFDYTVTALEKVFRAAVETGNPVRWC
jgi:hypothetical protein